MILTYPTCKVCGRIDKFNFDIPDNIWSKIVPKEYQNRVVCLSCFDEFAKLAEIDYSDYINTLYFAGEERGNFIFSTLSHNG